MRTALLLTGVFSLQPCFSQTWQWSTQIGGPGLDGGYIGAVDTEHSVYMFGWYAGSAGPTDFDSCYF
ncbi:MAG: hypothetical protein IPL52_07370 [Flavobacteriales bacterium]|nr:hypothetical protein [Flavobacteriales bacterium]